MTDPILAEKLDALRDKMKPATPEELAKQQAEQAAQTTADIAASREKIVGESTDRKAALAALAAEDEEDARLAKEIADRMAARALRIASFGVIEVVDTLRIPKVFADIRAKVGDENIDDKVILQAIGEAAGMKDFSIAAVVKPEAPKKVVTHSPESQALIDANVKAGKAEKAQKKAEDAVEKAKAEGKKTNELAPLVQAAKEAKTKAVQLRAAHKAIKDANAAAKAAKTAETARKKEEEKQAKAAKKAANKK